MNNETYLKFCTGTVRVISSDPPYQADNAKFTMVPSKPFYHQKCGRYRRSLD